MIKVIWKGLAARPMRTALTTLGLVPCLACVIGLGLWLARSP